MVSHLLFPDDYIVFGKASKKEGLRLLKILEVYKRELGQKLNREKTSLFFSKNTSAEVKEEVKDMFGTQIIHQHERYLGLLTLVGKGKKKAFPRILDQVGQKIVRWKGKLLLTASYEILIEAVAQATPMNTMNFFKLLDFLCNELNTKMRNFW